MMYRDFLKRLSILDGAQLLEVFHDLEDIEQVERIGNVANQYVKDHAWDDCK